MKKHYFLQSIITSSIYHLNLCQYIPEFDYLSILARTFRIIDIELSCRLSKKQVDMNVLAYRILVYSFARLSGFNQLSSEFKSCRQSIEDSLSDMSIVFKAIEHFKPFYKIFKSDNYYGITSF